MKLEKTDAAALLRTHIADFQPLMERVDLVLEGASPELPTDERLAAFAGSRTDNRLYELTYNGDKGEFYLDEYDKVSNTVYFFETPGGIKG